MRRLLSLSQIPIPTPKLLTPCTSHLILHLNSLRRRYICLQLKKKKKEASRHAENPESTLYFVSPVGFLSLHFRSLSLFIYPLPFPCIRLASSQFLPASVLVSVGWTMLIFLLDANTQSFSFSSLLLELRCSYALSPL